MNKMIATASKLNPDELMVQIQIFAADFSGHGGYVLDALLSALEQKIPSAEFVSFCENIH